MEPVIETDDYEEIVMDNGPIEETFKEYDFPYPKAAVAEVQTIRSELHAAGFKTLPGFAKLQAVLSFELADGGFVGLVPSKATLANNY